ncbi:hypothetical protein [Facilibium subflavum]|uniref:hypothetical protein n=1 Tax=Facilibium subflavum TaxID=2219058 RepID=UPI0013C331B9|nr:hypothetical protein [Facilibium subflavum]
MKKSQEIGVGYWVDVAQKSETLNMSDVVLYSIDNYGKIIKDAIFNKNCAQLLVATSKVITEEARIFTQGDGARKLGRKLLIQALKKDASWVKENLQKVLFSSKEDTNNEKLTFDNFNEVVYASTRMLHAWKTPAWVNNKAFIDGSYTCSCPALELAQQNQFEAIIIISSDPLHCYNDLFQTTLLNQESVQAKTVHCIYPDFDLKEIGVDYTKATEQGMYDAYDQGFKKGVELSNNFIAAPLEI